MGLNAYIQRCSILQLFIDLLVDHGFSREVTRVQFYFLLPTSKNFCGSLPTKTVNLYSAFYALIIVEVIVIVMDVIIQVFQTIVQRAFCTLSSLCRQLYLYRQLSLCIQLCFCRHPCFFFILFLFFPSFLPSFFVFIPFSPSAPNLSPQIVFFLALRAYKVTLLPISNACVLGHFIGPWR